MNFIKNLNFRLSKIRIESRLRFVLFFQNILEAEPELDELDHALVCPVCLDLLYEPHKVDPCKHIFCEPCLRRLGCKNPMNTSCPMCRQQIVYCEPQRGENLLNCGTKSSILFYFFTPILLLHTTSRSKYLQRYKFPKV